MTRIRLRTALAVLTLVLLTASACSAESLIESGIERAAENEGVELDLDIDLSGDGSIDFASPDGEGSITFDEDGNVTFESDDGSGSMSVDEDGSVQFETDDGSGSMSIDEDGNMVFETEEGSGSMTTTEDGGFSVVNPDGSSFAVSSQPPAGWPSELGAPASADPEQTQYTVASEAGTVTYAATFIADESDPYYDQVLERLVSAGWTLEESQGQTGFGQAASFVRGTDTAQVSMFGEITSIVIVQQN